MQLPTGMKTEHWDRLRLKKKGFCLLHLRLKCDICLKMKIKIEKHWSTTRMVCDKWKKLHEKNTNIESLNQNHIVHY